MLITDPIGDMIIRIKNAFLAKKNEVVLPHSKIKEDIAKILERNKYIKSFEVVEKKPQKELIVKLRYVDSLPAITGVKRLSKPGRRIYAASNKIPSTLNGYGITIISTNKGVMIDRQAREKNVGGELLCKIW